MLDQNKLIVILVILLLLLHIIFIFMGYFLYKIGNKIMNSHPPIDMRYNKKETIEINDTKIVTAIKTDNLEKKFQLLGDKKQSQENISSAIDKLKSMKG